MSNGEVFAYAATGTKPSTETKARWEAEKVRHTEVMERAEKHSCSGWKHGVFRGVTKAEMTEVLDAIEYFMGSKAAWSKPAPARTFDIEYVYQCTGGPAERCSRPWEWCGETVLFTDWKAREVAERQVARTFRPGQRVRFEAHDGSVKTGIISAINRQSVSVTVEGSGAWRVSPSYLKAV